MAEFKTRRVRSWKRQKIGGQECLVLTLWCGHTVVKKYRCGVTPLSARCHACQYKIAAPGELPELPKEK